MRPDASAEEVRAAYRRLARTHHPDARGGIGTPEMAAINEAWQVLSDPARRAVYDAGLRSGAGAAGAAGPRVAPRPDLAARFTDPPRFPWRFVLFASLLGALVVVALAALVDPPQPAPPDNVLVGGSCVVIETNGDAAEAACTGPHDGVVEVLVPFDGTCPFGTDPHRDRQGMGIACVRTG